MNWMQHSNHFYLNLKSKFELKFNPKNLINVGEKLSTSLIFWVWLFYRENVKQVKDEFDL